MNRIILNIGEKEFVAGLTYIAISRATKRENIFFQPFPNFHRFKTIFENKRFKARLAEEERLKSLQNADL